MESACRLLLVQRHLDSELGARDEMRRVRRLAVCLCDRLAQRQREAARRAEQPRACQPMRRPALRRQQLLPVGAAPGLLLELWIGAPQRRLREALVVPQQQSRVELARGQRLRVARESAKICCSTSRSYPVSTLHPCCSKRDRSTDMAFFAVVLCQVHN